MAMEAERGIQTLESKTFLKKICWHFPSLLPLPRSRRSCHSHLILGNNEKGLKEPPWNMEVLGSRCLEASAETKTEGLPF
jgi:hypothetical protein